MLCVTPWHSQVQGCLCHPCVCICAPLWFAHMCGSIASFRLQKINDIAYCFRLSSWKNSPGQSIAFVSARAAQMKTYSNKSNNICSYHVIIEHMKQRSQSYFKQPHFSSYFQPINRRGEKRRELPIRGDLDEIRIAEKANMKFEISGEQKHFLPHRPSTHIWNSFSINGGV